MKASALFDPGAVWVSFTVGAIAVCRALGTRAQAAVRSPEGDASGNVCLLAGMGDALEGAARARPDRLWALWLGKRKA